MEAELTGDPRHKVGDKKGFHHLTPKKARKGKPLRTKKRPCFPITPQKTLGKKGNNSKRQGSCSQKKKNKEFRSTKNQKTREGRGCPKFLAGKVFGQISMLVENSSPIFRQHEMLSLPRFGHFPARTTAA